MRLPLPRWRRHRNWRSSNVLYVSMARDSWPGAKVATGFSGRMGTAVRRSRLRATALPGVVERTTIVAVDGGAHTRRWTIDEEQGNQKRSGLRSRAMIVLLGHVPAQPAAIPSYSRVARWRRSASAKARRPGGTRREAAPEPGCAHRCHWGPGRRRHGRGLRALGSVMAGHVAPARAGPRGNRRDHAAPPAAAARRGAAHPPGWT